MAHSMTASGGSLSWRALVAATLALPTASSAPAGPPRLVSATVETRQSAFAAGGLARSIALTGPVTIEHRRLEADRLYVELAFDQPVLGWRRLAVENATLASRSLSPRGERISLVLNDVKDATHVAIRLTDVATALGVADAQVRLSVLAGDVDRNASRDHRDADAFARAYSDRDWLADMDGDGVVTEQDAEAFAEVFGRGRATLENLPPTVDAPERAFSEPGARSAPVVLAVRDDRTPVERLSVTASASDASLIPPGYIDVTPHGDNVALRFSGAPGRAGDTRITVTVSDNGRKQSSATVMARVAPNTPPEAVMTSSDFLGVAPLVVDFDASASLDEEDDIAAVQWDFAGFGSASGTTARIAFKQPGSYVVRCRVKDSSGASDVTERVITVAPSPHDPDAPITEAEARRFLRQAAFGPTDADVALVMAKGYEAWIDHQALVTPNYLSDALHDQAEAAGRPKRDSSYWENFCIEGEDQLRQRMAWALVQIIAIAAGNNEDELYNIYIRNALPDPASNSDGNYRQLLQEITYNQEMGDWLTYRNSKKADPVTGVQPDENYAREVMQLFTVGLWWLDLDGTQVRDIFGEPIPTYDPQTDVQQMARIFTGFRGGNDRVMSMRERDHEFGPKQLLNYPGVFPTRGYIPLETDESETNAHRDVSDALDNLFYHPSTAPFISRQLIQRLVTSNPTPDYVARVATAFEGRGPYGTGVRGDLLATAKAILLDDEARNPAYRTNPFYGKAVEPIVLHLGALRTFNSLEDRDAPFPFRGDLGWSGGYFEDTGQAFLRTPSVFNFYQPDFAPLNTTISEGGFVTPELQIVNENTALEFLSRIDNVADTDEWPPALADELRALADDPDALIGRVDMMLTGGVMTEPVRDIVRQAVIDAGSDPDRRVRMAVVLVLSSFETRVLR